MNGKRIAMGHRKWPVAVTAALILAAMIGGPVHAYLFNGSELVEYYNSDTGHYYMVVDYNAVGISNKSWGSAAFAWDSNSDYHLATSQTQVENDFIWGLIETFPDLSSSNPLSNNFKYWLGGFYNDGSAQTGGAGWYWIEDQGKFWNGTGNWPDGDIGQYTNWQNGPRPWQPDVSVFEPSGDGDYLAMYSIAGDNIYNHMGWWNDQSGTSGIYGYVLESFDGYTPIPDTVAIGGTVTGLEGSGLVLQNKGGDDLTIDADGPFTFDTALTPGSRFDVTVAINPANPEQSCRVQNGSGSVTSDPVTDIQVFCGEASSPSDDTAIIIETNVTDGNAGIRIFLGGEGWKKTSVANPDGRKVFNITAKGKLKQIGLAEMVTRSGDEDFSEMTQAELLALFPEGIYQFESKSVEGEKITKEARLSHDLPCAPQNLSPSEETVDTSDIDILWDAVNSTLNDTGDGCRNPSTDPITIENYHVIVEDVSTGNEFNVALPAFPDFNRVAVPGAFIEDDKTYRVEVLAIAENGNQTIAETFFCTGTPGDPCADPGPGP